jgi:3-methylcrotonyl-CoA carboxylase alpha subunit
MKYRLKTGEGSIGYETDKSGADTIRITDGDRTMEVSYSVISENEIRLEVDGVCHNVFITGDEARKTVLINGISYIIEDADLMEQAKKSRKGPLALPQQITPPMPSVVERIMVAAGDTVKKGDGIIVVSAMKMETTLVAPYDGLVTKINVAVGDKVMPGTILADIEKSGEDSGQAV